MTEEERAAAYRTEQAARATAEQARLRGLRGDPAARTLLAQAWQPPMLAAGELLPVAPGMYVGADDLTDDGTPGDLADLWPILP